MVQNQAYLFLVFSLTGVIIGIVFDIFRVLRMIYKTSDIATYIEDILFWVLAGIIILYNIWYFNDGEIRLFMILGIIMGAIIYALTLSNIFIKINSFIMSKIKTIMSFLYTIFKIPVKFIINIVKKVKNSVNIGTKKGNCENNGE